MDLLEETFVDNGVYHHKQMGDDSIFVCQALPGRCIGKLVVYKYNSGSTYEMTSTQYFLNSYIVGDMKELFIKRENYELLGMIGKNYILSDDKRFLLI